MLDFKINFKRSIVQRASSLSAKRERKSGYHEEPVEDFLKMQVFALEGQGESNGETVSPPADHSKELHTVISKCELESKGKRPWDDGPLGSGSGEASGIIGPPHEKRAADQIPTTHAKGKERAQFIVKTVSTTFSTLCVRQWPCVGKFKPNKFSDFMIVGAVSSRLSSAGRSRLTALCMRLSLVWTAVAGLPRKTCTGNRSLGMSRNAWKLREP